MPSWKRTLVAVAAAAASCMTVLPVGPADAAPRATVGGGSGIEVGGNALCTLATVGHDRTGRLVGLTAAHCGGLGAYVRAERNRRAGVIGRVIAKSSKYDIAVIELNASRVRAVSRVGAAHIGRVGAYPQPFATVCKAGRTTGYTCGPTLERRGHTTISYVCSNHGDSGGPIIYRGRLVGMLNGGLRIAGSGSPSIPCVNAAVPLHSPMVATKMTDIIAVLTRAGAPGAGFRPV